MCFQTYHIPLWLGLAAAYVCTANSCGSGLARESGVSVIHALDDNPPSRASPLPQGLHFNIEIEEPSWIGNPTSPSPPSSRTTAAS
ncbi:hypothetical protein EGM97_22310 [Pseudomonas sp. AF32]|nr:hypothetical protein [Pseudomonas sp. AF32]